MHQAAGHMPRTSGPRFTDLAVDILDLAEIRHICTEGRAPGMPSRRRMCSEYMGAGRGREG